MIRISRKKNKKIRETDAAHAALATTVVQQLSEEQTRPEMPRYSRSSGCRCELGICNAAWGAVGDIDTATLQAVQQGSMQHVGRIAGAPAKRG